MYQLMVIFLFSRHSGESQSASRQIWEGTLHVSGQSLRLRFSMLKDDAKDQFSGYIVSLDQSDAEIPISHMTVDEDKVMIELDALKAKFEGTPSEDGTECVGTWTQAGQTYDLTIRRIAK